MNILNIIEKKKNSKELSPCEVEFFVKGVSDGSIADIQISALLMAISINGMSDNECFALTRAMQNSGETVSLDGVIGQTVDKHSSGGVGDSTTFVIAPTLAALGYKVAKLSGRGLAHTGGTLDKLESIKGMRVGLTKDEFINQVNDIGIAVIGQSGELCPADKKLYAIRDVTATVNSIPLIASSIMSKKLAGGAKNIILDVKCGKGAFVKDIETAKQLAEKMVTIGKNAGRNTIAVITNMDEPLDNFIGNGLEIIGALKVLGGVKNRLYSVSKQLVANLLVSMGFEKGLAENEFDNAIHSGKALNVFTEMIRKQGGDISMLNEKSLLTAKYSYKINAANCGYISAMDCEGIGNFVQNLGAGRKKHTDTVEHDVGVKLNVKIGDYINEGEEIATVYYNKKELENSIMDFEKLLIYSDKEPIKKSDILAVIGLDKLKI